jgi:predicted ribosome quality control (RQC) complex YloA/Tae2 family protein
MQTTLQELIKEFENIKETKCKTLQEMVFFDGVLAIIEGKYLEKEKNQIKTKKAQNCESFFFEGFKIMLGANERENIYLLENSKASDFWFHLKDRPSCHVIVQNSKKDLPQNIIEKAASLCAKFSVDFGGTYEVDFHKEEMSKFNMEQMSFIIHTVLLLLKFNNI